MRKIKAAVYVSLDGVMESPAWTGPYFDDELAKYQRDYLFSSEALLLGRVTYEGFVASWPSMTDEDGFAERMNTMPKYVVSTTLEHTEWNAELLGPDPIAAIAELKAQDGGDLLVYASGVLIDALSAAGLLDELRLITFPVVVGEGKRMFAGAAHTALRLADAVTTGSGVIVATYTSAVGDSAEQV